MLAVLLQVYMVQIVLGTLQYATGQTLNKPSLYLSMFYNDKTSLTELTLMPLMIPIVLMKSQFTERFIALG